MYKKILLSVSIIFSSNILLGDKSELKIPFKTLEKNAIELTNGKYNSLNKLQQNQIIDKLKSEYINQEMLIDIALKSDIKEDKEYLRLYKKEIKNIERTIAVNVWAKRELEKTIITEKEILKFYNENKSSILITTPITYDFYQLLFNDNDKLNKMLEELKISNNITYVEKIIKKYSKESLIKENNIPIYKFKKMNITKYNKDIREQIKSLKANKYSVISLNKSNKSFVFLIKYNKERIKSLKETKEKIKEKLKKEKFKLFLINQIEDNKKLFIIK